MKANSLCHRGVRATNGHLIMPPRSGNELAPVHGLVPSLVPTEKIAHSSGRRLLHCGISTRLMSATGHSRRFGIGRESACLPIPDIPAGLFIRRVVPTTLLIQFA